jgi:beta-lactamase class A
MWISFKRKTVQPKHYITLCISVILVSAIIALIVTLLFTGNLRLPHAASVNPKTVATNGAQQWTGDDKITTPDTNFSTLSSSSLSISQPFLQAYQIYGTTNNSLGTPITTAFPTTYGWLQFFADGALLLPSTQNAHFLDTDDSFINLVNNGVKDPTTGVIRLPLIQTLLTMGSKLPVGGPGSTLTYVNLRNATAPALMKLASSGYRSSSNPRTPQSPMPVKIGSQGIFIQGGTRGGQPVGHIIPTTFWHYINQSDISPHTWAKDFGVPLTEALAFTMPVNGQTHHMLIQVFSREALLLDQDAQNTGQTQAGITSTGNGSDNTAQQLTIQLLPTGLDYLRTMGLPNVKLPTQKVVWSLGDTALLDVPGTGNPIAHIGQNFPLTLLADTHWVGGVLWYHIQWTIANNNKNAWIPASTLSFISPGNVPSNASFDVLSSNLSSYLNSLGVNVGAVVYDVTRQQTYTYNSSTPFITASSMKVPIMLTFLDSIEQQGREPTDDEMGLLTTMIENSNNDSASALFGEDGGAAGISSYMQKIGVSGLSADDDAWGYSTITPQTMVDLLTLLYNGKILNSEHRLLALNLMENVEADQQVGIGDTAPNNATVALKDGWVTGDDDLWAMNSSGIVTTGKETYIISVYTQEQPALENGQDITRKVCGTVASLLVS